MTEFHSSLLDVEIRVEKAPWKSRYMLAGFSKTPGGISVAQPLTMERQNDDSVTEPFVELTEKHAQQLMDDLFKCGIRPSEGSGSAGMLKATQDHLADMRKISLDLLDQLKLKDQQSIEIISSAGFPCP